MLYRASLLVLLTATVALAQAPGPGENQPIPRSDSGVSSSKDTKIDLSAPEGDALAHPDSEIPLDVRELRPYNPHRAAKNIEVGDYYFKQKNYRAALSRYEEANEYKPNDAFILFKLGQALEKTGKPVEAYENYQASLALQPSGDYSEDARVASERLQPELAARGYDANLPRARKALELGEEHYQSGNFPAAVERLREAVELSPHLARAKYRLAQALEKVGEFDQARRYYEEYLSAEPTGEFGQSAREAVERLRPHTRPTSSSG